MEDGHWGHVHAITDLDIADFRARVIQAWRLAGMAMLAASAHMSDGETVDLGTFEHHAEPPYLRQVSESSEGHRSDA